MKFIEDDQRYAFERWVVLNLTQEYPFGDDFDFGAALAAGIKAGAIADGLAYALP